MERLYARMRKGDGGSVILSLLGAGKCFFVRGKWVVSAGIFSYVLAPVKMCFRYNSVPTLSTWQEHECDEDQFQILNA